MRRNKIANLGYVVIETKPLIIGSWRTSGDHLNDHIVESGQTTEKNPEDLMKPSVTQTPVKDHQITLM